MAAVDFTILVVSDEGSVGALVATLRGEGDRVLLATSSADALALARDEQPGAVLLELRVERDAFALATDLRGVVAATTAIIVLTGSTGQGLEAPDTAGIDFALRKPVKPDLLGGLLRFVHGQRKQKLPATKR